MPRKQPQLAKLTRPRLHRAIERSRLFTALDEAHHHKAAVCVVGPPGAGKTTLVASWLDARAIKGIWYQVDPGDADLATFFYYLGEAAKPFIRKGQRPLPLLTPEYLQDVEGFSRRFFRELFAKLPEGAALALDNYQEVTSQQQFHPLVAQAVEEVPEGSTLIVISRRDPPDCYARLIAQENVCFLEWEDLRFNVQEIREIMTSRGTVPTLEESARWHQVSDGWAAGLTLMLEDDRRGGGVYSGAPEGRDAVFGYFAGNIFDKAPEHVRRFLMATAHMSQVPVSVARLLTGRADAGEILEDLYRRHLFTHRRPAQEATYWYHALFRAFLLSESRKRLSAREEREFKFRAAELLDAHDLHEDAFGLLCETHKWAGAEKLLLRHAASLYAQGRTQTLREWLNSLPEACFASQPRLHYWLGMALMPTSLEQARRHLELAYEKFKESNDTSWQLHSAAGIVDTWYFAWAEFQPMTRWARLIGELIEGQPRFESTRAELHVYSSWLVSMLFGDPGHPMLEQCVDRVAAMLDEDLDPNSKVMAGAFLMVFFVLASRLDRASEVMARIPPLLSNPMVTPLNRSWWKIREGYYLLLRGSYEEGNDALADAESIASEHGLGGLSSATTLIASYQLLGSAYVRNAAQAQRHLRRIERLAGNHPAARWLKTCGRMHLSCLTGNYADMWDVSKPMIEAAESTGMRYVEVLSHLNTASACCLLGMHDELAVNLQRARTLFEGTCFSYFESEVRLFEAWSRHARSEDASALDELAVAIRHARMGNCSYSNAFRYSPVLSEIFSVALRNDLEVGYVRTQIRSLRIGPSDTTVEQWPWPVRIFALGRFEIHLDGRRVEFSGKLPKKTLALLKILIAHGGTQVPEERLTDSLWPNEDADLSRKALDVTVVRLRKLLGSQEALIVAADTVSLNPQICWADAVAFEQLTKHVETAEEADASSVFERAFQLYRGGLLPADSNETWSIKSREKLRARFIRLVEILAQADERAGNRERAIARYAQGVEADDLVESFYQGLMRCYRSLGRHAEAMGAYRKLRHLLSVVLGISPSEATQALARALQRDNPAQF